MSARDIICGAKMVPHIIPPTQIISQKVSSSTVTQLILNVFQKTIAIQDSFGNSFEDTGGVFAINECVFNFLSTWKSSKINLINQHIKRCFGNLISQCESLELPLAQDYRNSLNVCQMSKREREEVKNNHKAPARISRTESCQWICLQEDKVSLYTVFI